MLTVPQAARQAKRNPETIRRWIRDGKLNSMKVGTQYLIDAKDLSNAASGVFASPPGLDADEGQRGRARAVSEVAAQYLTSPAAASAAATTRETWLPAIVGRIVRLVDPARVVLFGSRGRGEAGRDSDYDLLVVVDELVDRRATRLAIRRVLDDLPIAKDVVVATTDEASGRTSRPRGVLHWALTEGRVLYERV